MAGSPVVLSEGPLKGRPVDNGVADVLMVPTRPYQGRPPGINDTNPHRRLWVDLFGRRFHVWIPVDIPDDRLAEYMAAQILNPLGMHLWREADDLPTERAEKDDQEHAHDPEREGQRTTEVRAERSAYRPGASVPDAPGARGHHRGPGAG